MWPQQLARLRYWKDTRTGENGEPFLTLYPPDLISLPGHSYIHLVMTSPSGVVTLVRRAVRIGLRISCRTQIKINDWVFPIGRSSLCIRIAALIYQIVMRCAARNSHCLCILCKFTILEYSCVLRQNSPCSMLHSRHSCAWMHSQAVLLLSVSTLVKYLPSLPSPKSKEGIIFTLILKSVWDFEKCMGWVLNYFFQGSFPSFPSISFFFYAWLLFLKAS